MKTFWKEHDEPHPSFIFTLYFFLGWFFAIFFLYLYFHASFPQVNYSLANFGNSTLLPLKQKNIMKCRRWNINISIATKIGTFTIKQAGFSNLAKLLYMIIFHQPRFPWSKRNFPSKKLRGKLVVFLVAMKFDQMGSFEDETNLQFPTIFPGWKSNHDTSIFHGGFSQQKTVEKHLARELFDAKIKSYNDTVDGRNPAPAGM